MTDVRAVVSAVGLGGLCSKTVLLCYDAIPYALVWYSAPTDFVYRFQSHNRLLLRRAIGRFCLIGPHPSDYAHALSACYFLQAVFLPALGLWSSPPARRVSHHTCYSFLTFSVFLSTERIDESYIKAPTATSNCRLTTSEYAWEFFGR